MRCDQCEAVMINGVFCHEIGCPNQGSRFDADSEEWIKQRRCFECGCFVDVDSDCCNEEESERDWREMSFLERRAARYDNDQNYREDE